MVTIEPHRSLLIVGCCHDLFYGNIYGAENVSDRLQNVHFLLKKNVDLPLPLLSSEKLCGLSPRWLIRNLTINKTSVVHFPLEMNVFFLVAVLDKYLFFPHKKQLPIDKGPYIS